MLIMCLFNCMLLFILIVWCLLLFRNKVKKSEMKRWERLQRQESSIFSLLFISDSITLLGFWNFFGSALVFRWVEGCLIRMLFLLQQWNNWSLVLDMIDDSLPRSNPHYQWARQKGVTFLSPLQLDQQLPDRLLL